LHLGTSRQKSTVSIKRSLFNVFKDTSLPLKLTSKITSSHVFPRLVGIPALKTGIAPAAACPRPTKCPKLFVGRRCHARTLPQLGGAELRLAGEALPGISAATCFSGLLSAATTEQ